MNELHQTDCWYDWKVREVPFKSRECLVEMAFCGGGLSWDNLEIRDSL